MKNLLITTLALLFLMAPYSVNAQTTPLGGGDTIPEDITATDQENNQVDLNNLFGENGLVIVFYRSAKWCPYCQAQLINLKAFQDDIEDKGYKIVGISYDSVEDLKDFSDKRKITFPLLSDPQSQIIESFGILNTEHKEGSFAYGVPYPATYIVKTGGKIKDVLREEGYKKRPEVSKILEIIEE